MLDLLSLGLSCSAEEKERNDDQQIFDAHTIQRAQCMQWTVILLLTMVQHSSRLCVRHNIINCSDSQQKHSNEHHSIDQFKSGQFLKCSKYYGHQIEYKQQNLLYTTNNTTNIVSFHIENRFVSVEFWHFERQISASFSDLFYFFSRNFYVGNSTATMLILFILFAICSTYSNADGTMKPEFSLVKPYFGEICHSSCEE